MNRSKILKFASVVLLILPEFACGASPLLNHRSPDRDRARTSSVEGDAPESCTLRFERLGMCAGLEWVRIPSEEETGVFLLRFRRFENGVTVPADAPSGLKVTVKLWMPDMGHGSSPVKVVRPEGASGTPEAGLYRAEDVHFVMPGAWEIRVILKNETGAPVDQSVLPYQAG